MKKIEWTARECFWGALAAGAVTGFQFLLWILLGWYLEDTARLSLAYGTIGTAGGWLGYFAAVFNFRPRSHAVFLSAAVISYYFLPFFWGADEQPFLLSLLVFILSVPMLLYAVFIYLLTVLSAKRVLEEVSFRRRLIERVAVRR